MSEVACTLCNLDQCMLPVVEEECEKDVTLGLYRLRQCAPPLLAMRSSRLPRHTPYLCEQHRGQVRRDSSRSGGGSCAVAKW